MTAMLRFLYDMPGVVRLVRRVASLSLFLLILFLPRLEASEPVSPASPKTAEASPLYVNLFERPVRPTFEIVRPIPPHDFTADSLAALRSREMRAVWLTTNYRLDWPSVAGTSERIIARQKRELVDMLDRLQALGINTIFFQARLKGETFYRSSLEPMSAFLTGKPGAVSAFDPLAFAVRACHDRGMQIHAWMVCMPFGSAKQIARQGRQGQYERLKPFTTLHEGEYFLEPSDPRTADYLASIAAEIVGLYDVDGIHLDYIRYPEKSATFPDKARFEASGASSRSQWRRDNITHIVSTIYDRIHAVRPTVMLSSAPLGLRNGRNGGDYFGWNAYDAGYQEVERWFAEGKHDFVVPMMYYKDAMYYPFVADWVRRSHGHAIIPGLGIYRLSDGSKGWTVDEIERQIRWARQVGAGGYALFRARNLLDDSVLLPWRINALNTEE